MTPEQETTLLESVARLEDCVVRQQMRLDEAEKTLKAHDGWIKALIRANTMLKANASALGRKAELQDDQLQYLDGRCTIVERQLQEQAQDHLEQLQQLLEGQ